MKEQLAGWLLSTLQSATSALEQGAQFLGAQLPFIVQEFILFSLVWNWFAFIVCLSILIFLIIVHVKYWDKFSYDYKHYRVAQMSTFVGIPLVGGICYHFYYALLVTFAPRAFLLKSFLEFFK